LFIYFDYHLVVNGKLRCLGSTQHLKHRHGNGFEVNFKFKQPTDEQLASTWNVSAGDGRGRTPSTSQTNPDALWVSGRYKPDDLDHSKLTLVEITQIAHSLQHPECLALIAPFQSGTALHESLQSEGHVTARVFLDWWLTERYFARLEEYLQETFPPVERILLLERNNALTCRYRIQLDIAGTKDTNVHTNALSEIFAKLELAKDQLNIQEYSVGQTTLEQIFNHFAGMQDNPEVAMMMNATGANN
jgi:ATP-binding cassette subfamily A (ABC1) protein 3